MAFLIGEWLVDPDARQLTRGSEGTRLSPKAMAVLRALHAAQGRVLTRADLLDEVWPDVTVGEEVLTHAIGEIRKALGDSRTRPRFIETVPKAGYRLLEVRAEPAGAQQPEVAESPALEASLPDTPGSQAFTDDAAVLHSPQPLLQGENWMAGERKQITVLFADIKGSADRIEDTDPELVHRLLDAAIGIVTEVVHRYEGTLNKVMGDSVMVLFGAPLAHEDHAVRACYAALEIQDAVRRTADEVQKRCGVALRLRIGINSGEVVVQATRNDLTLDYNAIGQTTTLAARLAQQARPGSSYLSRNTMMLVDRLLETRPMAPITMEGQKAPVEGFELSGTTPTRTRFDAAVARGLTRFVGRQFEMGVLDRAAAQAREGHGQVVAVVGGPGVGKSRLLYEFVRSRGTEDWLVLQSGALSYGRTTAHLPVIDLIRSYFGIVDRDDVGVMRAKINDRLQNLNEDLQPLLVPLLALLDVAVEAADWNALAPAERRRRMLDAVRSILISETRDRPLVVVVEDLHWIDSETQSFLDRLIDNLSSARLLLLVNFRPEYRHDWSGRTCFAQCSIDTLSPDNAQDLLSTLIGDNAGMEALKRVLIERTAGNPFFLEENVRALVELETLTGEPGNYVTAKNVENVHIPATVQGVLTARLDRLGDLDKEILQKCAVVGKDVPYALLECIADLSGDDLRCSLARLQAGEFLHESRLFPDREYTFKHILTHEVAYGTLLQSQRRAYHLRIAEALESLHKSRLSENADRLAHHFTEADESERAVGYWLQAGRRAVERSANAEAVVYLSKGLELMEGLPDTPAKTEQEITFLLALGVPLLGIRGHASPEVEQAYRRASELCRASGDMYSLFFATWGLWRFKFAKSDILDARTLAGELLDQAQKHQDSVLLLQAHHAHWTTLYDCAEFETTDRHIQKGLALYDPGEHHNQAFLAAGHDPYVCARLTRAGVAWMLGFPDQAANELKLGQEMADALGHPTTTGIALNQSLRFCARSRNFEDVQRLLVPLRTLSEQYGLAGQSRWCDVVEVWANARLTLDGKDILRVYRLLLSDPEIAGVETPFAKAILADACGATGLAAEGLDILAGAIEESETSGVIYWDPEILRLRGELFLSLSQNHADQAVDCFQKAMARARAQQAKSLELRSATSLARLWARQGRTNDAQKLLSPVYGWFTEGFDTTDIKDAKALLDGLR